MKRVRAQKTKDFSREFGTRGHVTIPNLFSGKFIKLDKKFDQEPRILQQVEFNFKSEFAFNVNETNLFNFRERITLNHIKSIQILWKKIIHKLGSDMFPSHTREYEELVKLMFMVFGDDLQLIFDLAKKSEQQEYLAFLTVLTWVTAILRYRDIGTTVLFKEVRLFPDHYDVSLGRIDALEVVAIDSKLPTRYQTSILERLAEKTYDSVGHLIYVLVSTFQKKLTLKIHDWKFAVGDGDNGIGKTLHIIHFGDIQSQPLQKHKNQMDRYLSTAMISYGSIANSISGQKDDHWNTDVFELSGEIHYFFPDRMWITHKVELTNEEKKKSFAKIANGYKDGEFRRKFLNVSKSLLNLGLSLANGNGHTKKSKQLTLLDLPKAENGHDVHKTGQISQILKDSIERTYLDEFGIFEHFGKNKKGEDYNGVHFDKICEGIDLGKIFADPDPRKKGRGAIRCPVHQEKTASCHISLPKRIVKCFGCGVSGKIIESSIPANISAPLVVSSRSLNRETRQTTKLVIPQEHKDIMRLTQKLLKRGFMDSPGAKYLEEKRKLNAEVSHVYRGAGYGSLNVISGLLEEGFGYDKLLHYGILRVSEKVSSSTPLVALLQKCGVSMSEIQKVIPSVKVGAPDLVGLPFFPLAGELTYPLEIGGVINNIYGRSLDPNCPKKYRHTKLSSEFTDIPHGGFNMYESFRKEMHHAHPLLIVDEAVLNVETFIQISTDAPSVVGLIGVNNDVLFELLADFPGDLLVSLNNDDPKFDEKTGEQLFDKNGYPLGMTGQKNTLILARKVKNLGFTGNVLTFSKPFVRSYPQVKYNDLNQFWTEYGHSHGELIRARSFVEGIQELPDPNWDYETMKSFWQKNYPVKRP